MGCGWWAGYPLATPASRLPEVPTRVRGVWYRHQVTHHCEIAAPTLKPIVQAWMGKDGVREERAYNVHIIQRETHRACPIHATTLEKVRTYILTAAN